MNEEIQKPRKRIFIALLSLSLLCMGALSYAVWRITYLGLLEIHAYLPVILGLTFAGAFLLTGLGIVSMVAAIAGLPPLHIFRRQTYAVINFLFPLAVLWGKLFGLNRRQIERSFIAVSNQIIHQRKIRIPADRLLVVTPHCLQMADCPHKITRDPNNCKQCGRCDIGALVKLSQEIGFHFFVVTGGTLARQTVKKIRPKAVLAIACERDLTSGIQDVYPLPAGGVLNLRPQGPCYNTKVDLALVEKEIRSFLIEKDD